MTREKREYRATYTVLRVDPAFLPLSKDAKLYWHTAKLELPVSGIGVCLAHTIAGLASLSLEEAQHAEAELSAAGWLKREGAILWIVNGLRHTPNLKPKDEKHRIHIQRLLKDLPRDNDLVAEFRAYYAEWLEGPSDAPSQGPSQGPSEDHPEGHGSKKEVRSKKKEPTTRTTTPAPSDAGDSAGPELDAKPPKRDRGETWMTPFADAWCDRYGGDMPIKPAVRPLRALVDEHGADETLRRWTIYLAATEGAYANAARFASTWGEWNHEPAKRDRDPRNPFSGPLEVVDGVMSPALEWETRPDHLKFGSRKAG